MSKANRGGLLPRFAALTVLVAGAAGPGWSSSGATGVTAAGEAKQPAGMVAFGHIAPTSEQLVILAENARVYVHRDPAAADITVSSACPHDWNINNSMIRQAGFSTKRNGVAMMADALGSRAIVNGRIYSLPNGQISGGLQMNKEGVFIGGKKVEPLQGCDVPGGCNGPDAIDVAVPDNYSGNLILGAGEKSDVNVDSWRGGTLQITLVSNANLSAGDLTSLGKAVIDLRGNGTAEIKNVNARVLVTSVSGGGSVLVHGGKADISNATVTGDGKIIMKGTFNNLKQAVQGNGTIKVN
jgi:hypothetical protein